MRWDRRCIVCRIPLWCHTSEWLTHFGLLQHTYDPGERRVGERRSSVSSPRIRPIPGGGPQASR